jgi:uncharacterized membrane protein YfcA
VGVIGGVVSGFFGVGGAFIAPPLLTTFFGLRQLEAQGLALALVSGGWSIGYYDYGRNWRIQSRFRVATKSNSLCWAWIG